jgi:TolB-like protein
MNAPPPSLTDALRDRYTIERELGRGGMATVYLARDLRHGRSVALKVLDPDLSLGVGPERFRREIETAAGLEHPHILPMLDSGEAGGWLWYTMPFVQGESLRQRLDRDGALSVDDALRLARETADALDWAHRQGIVHRDVKPENILLSGGHVRVADFGIAKALEAAGGERLTGTGITVGTPAYMSPEQAAGARALDGRSDIYSLGCVLYELLTGQPPFSGATPQAVIARRFIESPPAVRQLRAEVPVWVEAAVARALAREPTDRFQTAAEFDHALAGTSAAPPGTIGVQSSPVPATSRPSAGRRWRLRSGVALLFLGILLGLGVLFAWYRADAGSRVADLPQLIAVLPFESLGDTSEAYFAEGMSDAVRGKLAALPGLQVISGASSVQYRHTTKPPQQIAGELGVRYLVVGRVRPVGGSGEQGRVQVSPELIEAHPRGAPTTRWQQPLDAPLADIFRLQAEISRGVAEALGVALGDDERVRLAEPPTQNLAAYQAYLRGEQVSKNLEAGDPAMLRRALPYYEQAVALDSGFVEALTRLAIVHTNLYYATPSPAEANAARAAAERALALAPSRPEGRIAMGDYLGGVLKEKAQALKQYTLGLQTAPNHVELLARAGVTEQVLGRWQPALQHFQRAQALDPRSVMAARTLAYALFFLRRYPEALAATDRALALAKTANFFQLKAMIYLAQGDLARARAVVRAALEQLEPTPFVARMGYNQDLHWVLEEPEQLLLLRLPPSAFGDDRAAWGLVRAHTYALRGEGGLARTYADTARIVIEERLPDAQGDAQLHALYGVALAYLGRKAEAIREGERAIAITPISKDNYMGSYVQLQLARIYLLVGEPDKALDHIEPLLRTPHYLSSGWLQIDPTFTPLRGNPRFERLVNGS